MTIDTATDTQIEQIRARTYVRTDRGQILVQVPADNQWGFDLRSDDQSWPGGFGVAGEWTAIPASDVSAADCDRLEWLLAE
jgi:hypothetical protein